MSVKSYDNKGNHNYDVKGELVCNKAFPSMPIYFWNDKDGIKFKKTYFDKYKGVWHHGDFINIKSNGGIVIYGRSDSTLNPGGVRIGTSEIYQAVENISFVEDSLVVSYKKNNDEEIVLFLKLKNDLKLVEHRINDVKKYVKINCSPRHVPAKIFQVNYIPYTINGKKVEVAVKKLIDGKDIDNSDSLSDPSVLKYYKNIPELKS